MMQMLVINSSHQSRIRLTVDEIFIISNQIQSDQLRDNDLANAVQQLSSRLEPLTNLQTYRNNMSNENADRTQPSENAPRSQETSHPPHVLRQAKIVTPNSSPEATCKAISGFKARMIYIFPGWLLSKMLDIHIAASACHKPCLNITVRAVVPSSAELFRLCRIDDDKGLQQLFRSRTAQPNDLIHGFEYNALIHAISLDSHKAVEVLLKAGTDPHYETPIFEGSAYRRAMDKIFSNSGDPIALEVLRKNFRCNDEQVEEYQFSKIHKIVLGLTPFSLLEHLVTQSAERGQIDQVDAYGRTALSWAVQRQDTNAVDLLLKANANPRLLSSNKCSPLAFAAFTGNLTCIKLLLQAGASVADKDVWGRTPLHFSCHQSFAEDVYRTLLAAGSEVNLKDNHGGSPFNAAAERSNVNTLKVLIGYGAEINSLDFEGDNPLLNALMSQKKESVQFLLQAGIDYTIVNKYGETLLHHTARCGHLQTIEILRAASLSKVDPYTRNHRSRTALQVIEERTTKLKGFTKLFQTLIWEISNRRDYLLGVEWRYRVPGAFETNELTEGQIEETVEAEGDGDASEVEDFFDASEQTN